MCKQRLVRQRSSKVALHQNPVDDDLQNSLVPGRPRSETRVSRRRGAKGTTTASESDFFYRIQQKFKTQPDIANPGVVGISSALRGEGRRRGWLGLASTIAQTVPYPIVLVEADMASNSLARDLNAENTGLADLRGEIGFDVLPYRTGLADLDVIFIGDAQGQELRLLRSERLNELFDTLRQNYATIIVDMPPTAEAGESTRLLTVVDQVFMAVEAGSTPKRLIKNSLATIAQEKQAGLFLIAPR